MSAPESIKHQLITAYNADAPRRSSAKERSGWKAGVRDAFVEQLKQEKKVTVLELGAGAGIDAQFFAKQGFDVLATDLSPKMVEACQAAGINAMTLDLYDIASLGRKFDAVYSMNVLLHIPPADLDHVLTDIHHVLEDDGLFFYGVYGGVTKEEIVTDPSRVNLPRYFSFLADTALTNIAQKHFQIVDHNTINIGDEDGLHFQSLLLRKM